MSMLFVFLVLLLCGNGYLSWHIFHLLPISTPWRWGVMLIIGIAALSSVAFYFFDGVKWPIPIATFFYNVGNSWIFIMLYLVLLFLVLDLGRIIGLIPNKFLTNSWIGTSCITALMIIVFIYANYRFHHKERVPLQLTTQKDLQRPLRFVLLSDIHAGFHIGKSEIAKMVDQINAEQPDYVLIAGDIIDINLRPLVEDNIAEDFRRIQAPVYAILGNHEYLAGAPDAFRFYKDANIHLLQDTLVSLPEGVTVIGRDDKTNQYRKSLAELTQYVSPENFLILLDHQPYHLEEAEQAGIDFQLSGHTHRGQMWPISWITDALYEKSWGRHQRGNTHYYISSGYGLWGAKFRVGTQSEYIVLEVLPK